MNKGKIDKTRNIEENFFPLKDSYIDKTIFTVDFSDFVKLFNKLVKESKKKPKRKSSKPHK
jgi:hypothetical protein